jgi:hypothetical protein
MAYSTFAFWIEGDFSRHDEKPPIAISFYFGSN